jgi:hypothetical protein
MLRPSIRHKQQQTLRSKQMSQFMRSFNVTNATNWGKLVKSWSTGKNYFHKTKAAPLMPNTVEELMEQCQLYHCGATVADWVKGLAIVHYSPETLVFRLPPKALIERSEAMLNEANTPASERSRNPPPRGGTGEPPLESGDYPLPDFYTNFLKIRPDQRSKKDVEDFHHARIGEYSVNSCM